MIRNLQKFSRLYDWWIFAYQESIHCGNIPKWPLPTPFLNVIKSGKTVKITKIVYSYFWLSHFRQKIKKTLSFLSGHHVTTYWPRPFLKMRKPDENLKLTKCKTTKACLYIIYPTYFRLRNLFLNYIYTHLITW